MIQHIKYITFILLLLPFFGCKNNNSLKQSSIAISTIEEQKKTADSIWKFKSIYPIGNVDTTGMDSERLFY